VILSRGSALQINLAELKTQEQKLEVRVLMESGDGPLISHSSPQSSGITLADAERDHILGALRETGWVLGGPNGAAVRLDMKRTTPQSKRKNLGIAPPG